MKERPLATCEREFILQIIKQKKRLDSRQVYDYRNVKISFGIDHGCCHVNIGDTMVMAQVTCNIIEPKQTRPNEGCLMINLDFNHIACPGYEPGRLSRNGVQINRLLERCIKECRCVDLESLCVIAEKQQRPLNNWRQGKVSLHNRWRAMLSQCTQMSSTVVPGHPNPCWSIDLPIGCEGSCQRKTVCAPKVIFAGINGCYSTQLLSPFSSATNALLVNERVQINGMCPLEYLSHNYQERLLGDSGEPFLYLNDHQLLTSSIGASQNDLPLGGKARWLSHWLQTNSRIIVILCDPTIRLSRYIGELMVIMEPTKDAVHNYVVTRINKAMRCIKEHGAKGCQKLDLGDDQLYSYLLQGIYLPYMADLRDHLPSQLITPLHVDYSNSTAYSVFINELSQALSIPPGSLNLQELEEFRVQEEKKTENIMLSISPETLHVWEIRVDIKVLNHDGNILDACSLAAITALAHFKRPDVSVNDGKITIHPADEKAYISLSVHHMPICVSFSFFHSGDYLLIDASYEEERVREGHMVIAMNKHREICALHMNGTHLPQKDQVMRCTNIAASKVLVLTELVQQALQNDTDSREKGNGPGSAELNIHLRMHSLAKRVEKEVKLRANPDAELSDDDEEEGNSSEGSEAEAEEEIDQEEAMEGEQQIAGDIGSGGVSSWNVEAVKDDNEEHVSEQTKILARKRKRGGKKKVKVEVQASDSEEEEVVELGNPG